MKRKIKPPVCVLACLFFFLTGNTVRAQIPVVSIVSGIIKKVIIAIDLKVQQLQNQTIALQNAEQSLENSLHLSSLNDINSWLGKERKLYADYYEELATVKTIISGYDEIKTIISRQKQLLAEYQSASRLFHQDRHFSASELQSMENIYSGILQESLRNLNEALLAVSSFSTQMDDAERMLLVHHASAGMQTNLDHLRQYNSQNETLSLERARDDNDRQQIRQLYGLP
ncbi:conjugal transfer protein TraI [Mucilaginibacter sp. L3T2-6]|uniref:conjugal transfer protein TraI n=1 Tax=Mucilaginibacter sp. L3T2-6 TaxID=3062491 RepID=UPI0026773D62|nr:conjugal transfer protein TraI [Mucilaginibacter sp. L3T2-6]MDO3641238.1 conjugal transfer protein TraI [Mucilaginibacter sp. L3T2-6]MDV6214003.1 conjugal transfer protein TraI [Mucilaginibacter sp. L3T2-6]